MTNERPTIIKEVGVWFGDLSNQFSDDATFGFVIRGMITRLKQGEIPERKMPKLATTPLRKDLGEVFKQLDELRNGDRPPKRGAEAVSIQKMLKRGFTPQQIIDTWKTMKGESFWQHKELFMMTVESQIGAITNNKPIVRDTDKYFAGNYGHMVKR